jgi:hypothetical protein
LAYPVESDRRDRPTKYAIGSFSFDGGAVTLAPGVYTLRKPIVFGVAKETEIEGVDYRALVDSDADVVAFEHAISHDHAA